MVGQESLRDWLDAWRGGDQEAAAKIYHYYERRARDLADRKIGPRLRAKSVTPDSVMLSAMNCVLNGIADGRYVTDTDGTLWNLVAKIVERKVAKSASRRRCGTVGIPEELADSNVESPMHEVAFADQLDQIRSRLKPDDFEILLLWLDGYSYREISQRMNVSPRTVQYKMNRIGSVLRSLAANEP